MLIKSGEGKRCASGLINMDKSVMAVNDSDVLLPNREAYIDLSMLDREKHKLAVSELAKTLCKVSGANMGELWPVLEQAMDDTLV